MPNEFLKEVQRQAAENFNAQQHDGDFSDVEQFMGQFGYKPKENIQNEETANNGFLGWAKDAVDSGIAGVLGGQAKLADTFLGVGGDVANYFGDVAKRNARTKEYNSGDIVPFASDYYTNPQGFTYDAGNLIGSMLALGGETAAVAQAAAPVLSGLGYEGLSAAAGALAGRAASAGMPALANALRSKFGTLILANVAKTPFEVASEMGNSAEDVENKGGSLDEQKKAALINGLVQMPLLTLSNTVEGMGLGSLIGGSAKTAFGKAAKAAAGIAGGAAQQSWEEGMQAASSNYASGDRENPWGIVNPTDWKEDEMQQAAAAFAPGMLFGGLGVGAGHVARKMGAISDLSDGVKGNGGGSPPDGYPKDDGSVGDDNNSVGGSSIVENMAALEGVMPYHVPEGTTCMRSVSTAVRNATGGAWPQIDYVPTAIEKAQEMGLWHDADYQPKAGDIAIVNGDNHAVMYDGEGGTWQSGESHNGIYHSTQSPTEMFGKVTGWISTSDLANEKGTNSTYSSQNAQNNMPSVMDFLKENQFTNDTDANNDITDALESGNDEKMFKVAEKLGYKPLIDKVNQANESEDANNFDERVEPNKYVETPLQNIPNQTQLRTQYPKYSTKNQGYIGRYSPQKLKQISKLSNRALLDTARNINGFSNEDLLKQTVAAEARKRGIIVGDGFEIRKNSNIATIPNGPKDVGLSGNQGEVQFKAQFPSKNTNVAANLQKIVDKYIGNTQSFQHDYQKALQDVRQMVEVGRVNQQQARTYLQNLRAVYDQVMPAIQDGAIRMGKEDYSNHGENFSFHSADDTKKGADYKEVSPESARNDVGKWQQIPSPQSLQRLDDFKNKVAKSHSGKSTQVVTDDGTEFNAQYKVIDADNIIASNKADNSFAPNKLYPSELQPRNRASVAMQGQVRQMAANLRPADLGESRNLNTGAPLINDNGVVENGNGRVMAITRALKGGNEAGKNYKQYLVDNADKYGLDAAIIQGMKSPVLVRQRLDDVDTNKIITSTAGGAVMGATEQGLSDAKRLDTNTLRKYVANDNGDLTTGGNRNFVISALKDIVGKDMGKFNALLTADGDVSQQGITRVRNALFAKAYKDNGLLAIMSESTDNNIRNITNAMLNAAPYIAEIQARMSNGSLYDYNLSGEVTAACKKLVKLRDEGKPVSTYLVEQSMFGEELSDTAKDIISFLDRNKNSAKKINTMLQRASKLVEDLGDPNQGRLYGEVKMPTVSEIYNKSIGDVEGEESNSQGELFNAGTKSGTGKASSEENQMGNGVLEGKYGSNETSQQDKQTIQDERPSVQQKEVTEKNSTKNNRSEKNESGISMPQKAAERIEDFGEKIGGAKKDLWKLYRQSMDAIPDADVANSSLAKVFPELNYKKALENGMPKDTVSMIRSLRDIIPNKPRGTKYSAQRSLEIWAEATTFMREEARQLMNGEISPSDILENLNLDTALGREMRFQYDLYTELGHDNSLKKFGIRKHNNGVSVIAGQKWNPEKPVWEVYYSPKGKDGKIFSYASKTVSFAADYETALKKAIPKIPLFLEYEGVASAKKNNYIAYSSVRGGKKGFYVGKKIGGKTVDLAGPFTTAQEALSYRTNNTSELEKKVDEYKYVPSERKAENAPRIGNDWRKGKDISPKMLSDTFGFRGIEFGNYVENARRQNDLNRAFDSLMDLANIIGVDTRALSLNGSLGLAFGARGSGSAAAHYEPTKVVINLTKNNGAGSLAHEWWHAFDNAIAQQERHNPTNFVTGMVNSKKMFEKIRKPVVLAFEELEKEIRYSGMYNRSKNMTSAYWITPTELGARAFEKFVNDKMNETGYSNDYLANIQDLEAFEVVGKDDRYPYPTKEESVKINDKFQKLFDVIEQKETDKGIELYSVKQPGSNSIIMTDNELVQAAKESFPTAKNIVSNGNSVSFELPNGSKMTIDLVNGIVATAEDRERASKEHGIPVTSNEQLQGSMRTIGIDGLMQLTRDSEKGTIDHEVMEFAKKIAFTPKENADMDRLLPGKEAQCNAYRDWQKQGKGRLGKLWRKIQDIINQVKTYFGSAEAKSRLELEKYYKQVASGEVFNIEHRLGAEQLHVDMGKWKKLIHEYDISDKNLWKKENDGKLYDFMKMPLVLNLIGANQLNLQVYGSFFNHVLAPKHGGMSINILNKLPKAMTEPLMIFKTNKSNKFMFVLELTDDNGATVVVPVELEKIDKKHGIINIINSAYGRTDIKNKTMPFYKWFTAQFDNGNLLYADKEKSTTWAQAIRGDTSVGLALKSALSKKSILSESDLVKLQLKYPEKYSVVPKSNDSANEKFYHTLSDENGKPLIFFHGTPKSFDSYDINEKERTNNGEQGLVWFTDSKKAADSFSYEKLDSKKSSFIQEKGQKGVVKQANLIMQQPLDLRNLSDKDMQNLWTLPGLKKEFASYNEFTDKMRHWSEIGNSRLMKVTILSSVENPVKEYNKHIRALQQMGYDGIIADMGKEYDHASEYGVFDTQQIKEISTADKGQENKNIKKPRDTVVAKFATTATDARPYYDENSGPKFNVSKKSIADYVNVVLANPGKKLRLKLGKVSVSEAKVIRTSTGLDVEGYEHVWKSNDVRHIEKRHGIGNEKQAGQIGLSKEEIVEAIYAIKNPNKIEKGTPTNNGEPSIRFVQNTGNNYYTAVEVVRDASKTLSIKTIWKKAINKHHDDNDVALLDTSKTAIDSPSSVEQRLPQKNQAVNYEEKKDSATDVSYSVKSAAGEFIKKLSTGDTGKDKEEKLDTPEARGNAAVSHNPKAPIKQRIMDVKKDFYKNWIDSLEPINKLQKQIEIIAGEKLDYEHDVYKQARMANSFAIGRANMLVSGENPKEVIKAINQTMKTDAKLKNDVTLQSVFEIIPDKEMKSKYAEYFKRGGFKNSHDVLSTYLMSARLLELQDAKRQNINRLVKEMSATRKDLRSTEKERESKLEALEKELKEWNSVPEYKGPISNSDARAIVENAPEEFQRAADAYYKFNDNMLVIAEDAGLISHETHTMLNEKYSHYAPMLRDFSDTAAFDKFMGALGGKGVVNVTTFLKRITKFGSERKVIDPLESTIKNLFAICDKAERNKVAQIFVDLSEDNKAGKFAMRVEATSSDPNNSIFTVMVNGEKQAFKTDPEFYGALAGYTEAPATIVSSLFKSTAQALRTGATISPDFIVRNLVRDTIFAGISSKTGFVPVIDSAKGMWALKHDKQLVEEFKAAGVPMSNFVGSNRRSAALTLDKMAGGDKSWRAVPIKKLVSTLYEAVQDASELAESGTRMGEFMRARKQGLSIEEAGFLAKELTLDFGRSGIYGRKVNSAVPFFNACIQGSDKMYRLLRYNPRKTTIALAKYIMLPSLMLWAMNYDKDWYKELPDDVKNGSWVWKVGDTIFRLPKPQEAGVLFGSGMERFLDACANNDPKAVADWAKYMLDVLSPNVLPTLVLPLLEWKTNYSFFTGKAVVGRREQNLPDDKQYNIYTTEFAKFLGRNTNTSPEKWDNTIKGYFGTAGAFVAQSMDNLFGTEYTKAEKLWSEQPGIKGFTFTEGKRSKSVEEWYAIYNEISKEHSANGIKGHPAFYVKQANSLNKKLGELNKASTTVIMNKNLSPEQKRQYLDNIDSKKVQLAKLGVQRYRKYVKD